MGKVTKRDMFVAIAGVLEDLEDTEELVAMVEKEIALIDKRAARPRKATATQVANEAMKADIVEVLATGEAKTATEIADEFDVSTQKVAALLRQLVLTGAVTRVEGKGKTKTTFTVAG